MGEQHTVLLVKCANNNELDDDERAWRAKHAVETIGIAMAWFDYGPNGNDPTTPLQLPDGTFKVHAPSANTLSYLKERLLPHEGFIIIEETQEDGDGVHPIDYIDPNSDWRTR